MTVYNTKLYFWLLQITFGFSLCEKPPLLSAIYCWRYGLVSQTITSQSHFYTSPLGDCQTEGHCFCFWFISSSSINYIPMFVSSRQHLLLAVSLPPTPSLQGQLANWKWWLSSYKESMLVYDMMKDRLNGSMTTLSKCWHIANEDSPRSFHHVVTFGTKWWF